MFVWVCGGGAFLRSSITIFLLSILLCPGLVLTLIDNKSTGCVLSWGGGAFLLYGGGGGGYLVSDAVRTRAAGTDVHLRGFR